MRTPKNFDGTSPTGKMMSALLRDALAGISKQAGCQGHEILAAWSEVLGEKFANLTKATGIQDGVLTVKVKSSTLYSLLHQHEKSRLLARLQELFPSAGIRDIVFRVGRFT
ncbi:MAG TPA: DUF721 domain-containing protein [Parachlamydiales bacterium]|nr:DUF721 domain-containing protein [Parachlamydiales bacterium]